MNRTTCEHFTPIDLHCDHCADKPKEKPMTRADYLEILMLLSGIESAMLTGGNKLPDYLLDRLTEISIRLQTEVLK